MKTRETIKLGLVLTAYAVAACVGLAFVYAKTKAEIDKQDMVNLEIAIKELFPDAESFEDLNGTIVSSDSGVSFVNQYSVIRGGKIIGTAVQGSTGSYGGPIVVLVGVSAGGTINRVKIMSHSDTPGLGANAGKSNYFVDKKAGITFYDQFTGKKVSDSFEAKNDVIAITAATITSAAVSKIVKTAGQDASRWLESRLDAEGAGR
jgi:electron transport complex protein RnfG